MRRPRPLSHRAYRQQDILKLKHLRLLSASNQEKHHRLVNTRPEQLYPSMRPGHSRRSALCRPRSRDSLGSRRVAVNE